MQQEANKHDPSQYDFTRVHKTVRDVSSLSKSYFYKKPLVFQEGKDALPVFQMNKDIYKTANMVDTMVAAFSVFSTYKFGASLYKLSIMGLTGWGVAAPIYWGFMILI